MINLKKKSTKRILDSFLLSSLVTSLADYLPLKYSQAKMNLNKARYIVSHFKFSNFLNKIFKI